MTFSSKLAKAGKVYVGDFEARVTPVADTDPKTALGDKVSMAPGTYKVLLVAPGGGFTRSTVTVTAGKVGGQGLRRHRQPGLRGQRRDGASSTAGSLNPEALIDDTENTNWGGVTTGTSVDDSRPQVAIKLAGTGVQTVHRVNVSAMLRPAPASATDVPLIVGKAAADDPDSGSRFTALRKFAIDVCSTVCTSPDVNWNRIYVSPDNAFPGVAPRPVAPDLTLRSFDVPDTKATAVRLVVLENQCSGAPAYAGEQDNDPTNDTDCKAGSDRDEIVHAAELQVF